VEERARDIERGWGKVREAERGERSSLRFRVCESQSASVCVCDWVEKKECEYVSEHKVADMAFKSQKRITKMPGKDTNEDAFTDWTDKIHRALTPILWEIFSDTYTMFKIEYPNQGDLVCDL